MKNNIKQLIVLFLIIPILFISLFFFNSSKLDENDSYDEGKNWRNNIEYSKSEDLLITEWLDVDLALVWALKRFEKNEWKDLWDYEQLIYIYKDLGDYEKIYELWTKAIDLMKKNEVNDNWIFGYILWDFIQAYLYDWKLEEAEKLLNEYSYLRKDNFKQLFFENILLQYKKWNYEYLVKNRKYIQNEEEHLIWWELLLLSKVYLKKWDVDEAIEILEDIYEKGLWYEDSNKMLSTLYLYVSTLNLKELYSEEWNYKKASEYESKFKSYKKRIDDWEVIDIFEWENITERWLKFKKDRMYFNINRFNDM